VNDHVIHVLERIRHPGRPVLSVHGRDREHRLDVEVEVELHVRVVGIMTKTIKRRGDPDSLSAARVSHQADVVHVDLVRERTRRAVVPMLPHLEMLEQEPRPAVALATQPAVDEILIDRHENESARRQQLAEVAVAGIGVVERIVVAVNDRARAGTARCRRDTTRAR
jgi:hypothetical protein